MPWWKAFSTLLEPSGARWCRPGLRPVILDAVPATLASFYARASVSGKASENGGLPRGCLHHCNGRPQGRGLQTRISQPKCLRQLAKCIPWRSAPPSSSAQKTKRMRLLGKIRCLFIGAHWCYRAIELLFTNSWPLCRFSRIEYSGMSKLFIVCVVGYA